MRFLINKKVFKTNVIYVCTVLWFIFWCVFNVVLFSDGRIIYYKYAFDFTFDKLREYHASYDNESKDYYKILKICDKFLPTSDSIQLIIPDDPANKLYFLREKGRYYLYPKNYGNNDLMQENILVYGKKNYQIPDGYSVAISFGKDKYLLRKTGK